VIIGNRKRGDADFAYLILEIKETPLTNAAGFGENQGQKIFIKSETHLQKGLLQQDGRKYLLYL
jgi:threonine dehydratase